MTKTITFSTEETLIVEVREAAQADNTTLNEQFRSWLGNTPASGACNSFAKP